MKLVYVCSPCRGIPPYTTEQLEQNLELAAKYSQHVAMQGHIPITPHLYFSFLDDTIQEERNMGIAMGRELLRMCEEVWVFGQEISQGMRFEIVMARRLQIPVHCIEL